MTSISRTGAEDSSSYPATLKAEKAEREATRRMEAAENQVRQAEAEQEQNLAYVKDQYQKQFLSEEAHQDALLEAQRLKGYENLRDLHRSQNEETNRVRQEGDSRLNTLRNYYRDSTYSTEQKGTEDLKNLEYNNEQNLEYTRKAGTENLTDLNEEYQKNTSSLANQYETKEIQLKSDQQRELDRKRMQGNTASELAESKYQEQFEKLNSTHANQIKRLETDANKEILAIRQETADKLATYRTRQNDPFYKLMDLDPDFSEDSNQFILKLKVPEYEQKNFSVTIKGENIVVTGQRRNEETLDLGNGVSQGTASYQSYHESFPLTWPVDSNKITKEFDENTVTIRVPKKNMYAAHEKPRTPPKAAHESAHFPTGIQDYYVDKQIALSRKPPTKGSPGSGPLT